MSNSLAQDNSAVKLGANFELDYFSWNYRTWGYGGMFIPFPEDSPHAKLPCASRIPLSQMMLPLVAHVFKQVRSQPFMKSHGKFLLFKIKHYDKIISCIYYYGLRRQELTNQSVILEDYIFTRIVLGPTLVTFNLSKMEKFAILLSGSRAGSNKKVGRQIEFHAGNPCLLTVPLWFE